MQALSYLKYGTIGLCAILTYFAYQLLSRELRASSARPMVLRAVWIFMSFSVVSMLRGLLSQLPAFRQDPSNGMFAQLASGYDADYFKGRWKLTDGHDNDFGLFKARYAYSGMLSGKVEGGELVLDGDITTLWEDVNKEPREVGTARFTARGPINNNQVAAHFIYQKPGVKGFGTAFFEFDSSGHATAYEIVRITRVMPGEGDVASVTFNLEKMAD